ncbi:amidohydrolase family protein [Pyruvatibacter mobilis]|uniref:amidohydrolase family protein n=1 Tax=Pyruvatibacter mobilis TaxID=1712261 RepID=UPI003BAC93D6
MDTLATTSEAAMIIDAWGQHPTLRHSQDPIFDSLRRWTKTEAPTEQLPVSVTIAMMDQADIDRMLISAWVAPRNVMISNDEVAGFVAEAPDRLVGVGSVDISRPMDAVREIRRCVRELGFRAIRVLPWLWEVPPTDRRFYPVYAACVEEGVPFCTQIGHTGPLMPSEVGRPIYLDQVALDFPELVIVGGHIGYPWTDEAIAVATKHENVYIDTSAYTARRYPDQLVAYLRGNGARKVMFGTNYPMFPPAAALKDLDALGLSDETRALFLGGNARRVFGL